MTEEQLLRQMKERRFLPVYLLFGVETHLLQTRAKQLIRQAVGKQPDVFSYCRLQEAGASVDEICNSATTQPVFSDIRLTEVVNPPLEQYGKDELSRLSRLFASLSDRNLLLFLFTDPAFAGKPSSKLKTLMNGVETAGGGVVQFGERSAAALVKTLTARAGRMGASLSTKTAYALIERCGKDLTTLLREVDKLSAYAAGREITTEDVRLMTVPTLDAGSFDLSRAVLQGNSERAFAVLDELFAQQMEPLLILGALSVSFVDLYRAKCAQLAGEGIDAITGYYPYRGQDFRMRNAMREASRFSYQQLCECVRILSDTDRAFKTTGFSQRVLLEMTVAKMLEAGGLL